jgi:hypothetical protein
MAKPDLKKELKYLYAPSAKKVGIVDVPEFNFVMIDGIIEPGETPGSSESYRNAIGALYGASYTLKFMSKLRQTDPLDYTVMALEGLWWTDAGDFSFNAEDPWRWTMMMLQPDHIGETMFQEALQKTREKAAAKSEDNPAIDELRFERFHEGLCMQIMHIGPYSEEPRTIAKMEAFAAENGYQKSGKHHEIYLGDPRRAKPERLKTILRQPVSRL